MIYMLTGLLLAQTQFMYDLSMLIVCAANAI